MWKIKTLFTGMVEINLRKNSYYNVGSFKKETFYQKNNQINKKVIWSKKVTKYPKRGGREKQRRKKLTLEGTEEEIKKKTKGKTNAKGTTKEKKMRVRKKWSVSKKTI